MLLARWSRLDDGSFWAEERLYGVSHELVIIICDKFAGCKSHVTDESLEGRKDIML